MRRSTVRVGAAVAERQLERPDAVEQVLDQLAVSRDDVGHEPDERDLEPDDKEHSLELFVLGELDNYKIKKNKDDPDYKENHEYVWIDINKLPKNLYPVTLTSKLISNFHDGFPNQGEYLGAIK